MRFASCSVLLRRPRRIGKAKVPLMHPVDIREATHRKRTEQVQRCGCLSVSFQHTIRVRSARFWSEIDIVDDIPTVRWQLHSVDQFLRIRRARLRELSRHAANFYDWNFRAIR